MTRSRRRLQAAAVLMFLAAALHLPLIVLAFERLGVPAALWGLVLLALGWALMGGRRLVAWVSFLTLLGAIVVAAAWAGGGSGLIASLARAVLVLEGLALAVLFVTLWRDPPPRARRRG
ncbi:hypothetical protein SAMN05216257_102558 [Meinhardsimonia xiamenensis]|jgi:hypothetical protein|uniref:Uncharacterized protein n=1 Tax=Meinhardsimonia xiamenensis TaxID=990712 RepID=A0A1G9BK72_9RHOB|nr:hypothetical protein [Meinhardsimonia xiamenensis]PRX34968.1 hypothetical protein LV81_01561 [Meinhardsimonia xiamenensis]SDK39275.1 hypothetical protein SAMN05216257_102558 [Meinhardsimonia xiamenensis]